jgi:hypothetical protein
VDNNFDCPSIRVQALPEAILLQICSPADDETKNVTMTLQAAMQLGIALIQGVAVTSMGMGKNPDEKPN